MLAGNFASRSGQLLALRCTFPACADQAGAECRRRRRWRCTTESNHARAVAPNRLKRQFQVAEPNRVWVADLTALWTLEGWLYLAAVLDLHDRQLIGWAMPAHMRTELAVEALNMALGRRPPTDGTDHHSARQSVRGWRVSREAQSAWPAGLDEPQGRLLGQCGDGTLLRVIEQRVDQQPERYITREQARRDVIEYIEMHYNSDRLHSTLGYITRRE